MACAAHPGSLEHLIHRNRLWASHKTKSDPAFFRRLVAQQRPRYFWIGCSDSRVPATEIVDLDPGEMFVHRNVANLASEGDPNFEATLSFAVETLGVGHVIVVGHYGCGGVHAAREPGDGALGCWLGGLHTLFKRHQHDLARLKEDDADNRLCELNVLDQIARLQRHPAIVNAWRAGRQLFIHGWVYAIGDGLIADLCAPISGPNDEGTSL